MPVKPRKTTKTRDLAKTRKQILSVTFLEVFKHGFQGVSIDDIVVKTNLTKGALFHQFPTKLDLGYALVEEVITPMILERWITPLQQYKNPLEGILVQMEKNIGQADPKDLRLGCPLNNLVQEMVPVDRGFKIRLQKALNLWITQTEEHLIRAKKEGYLKSHVNTREAAQFIVMAHEGFYGLIKGLDDPQAFKALVRSLRSYFELIAA